MRRPGRRGQADRFAAGVVAAALIVVGTPAAAAGVQPDGMWWRQAWKMDRVSQQADGSGVTVAVIDDGVDGEVSGLQGTVVPGLDLRDPEGDGRTDYSEHGHGTAMASLIAGHGGEHDFYGVAPGVTIYPVATGTTIHDSRGRFFDMVEDSIEGGADVLSISMGVGIGSGGACPDEVANAVRYALTHDAVVVAAVGNTDLEDVDAPASCPGVVTVGAVNEDLSPWESSNSSEYVDVAAPGTDIAGLMPDGRVSVAAGTSNATALVSGVVALLRQRFPEASADEIVTRLVATARDVGPSGVDEATGHGMVRPWEALTVEVPADASNPVYDPLGDLQGLEWVEPTEDVVPEGPEFEAPAAGGDGDGDGGGGVPSWLLLAAGGALLVVAVAGGLWATTLRRRGRPDAH